MSVESSLEIPINLAASPEHGRAASFAVDIRPTSGWVPVNARDLWRYRELLYFLVWRDLKVRYKQTALGLVWIVLQPLVAALIFSVMFGYFLQVPSGDVPYPLFALAGLVPWNYFAGSLTRAGTSLVSNVNLVTKVYFPRILVPLAGATNGVADLLVSLLILACAMVWFRVPLAATALALPLFMLLAVVAALGVSLWLAALNVHYRDVNHLLPFLTQVWMYATPVVYPSSIVPERWRPLVGLNPMASVVEGFRWALTGRGDLSAGMLSVSVAVAVLALLSGALFFRRTERTFADVI